jgi:adenylate kinase family enzyme
VIQYHDSVFIVVVGRDMIREQAPTNKQITEIMQKGDLLPKELVNDIVFAQLAKSHQYTILDGTHLRSCVGCA